MTEKKTKKITKMHYKLQNSSNGNKIHKKPTRLVTSINETVIYHHNQETNADMHTRWRIGVWRLF